MLLRLQVCRGPAGIGRAHVSGGIWVEYSSSAQPNSVKAFSKGNLGGMRVGSKKRRGGVFWRR
jgi:hypothetical protein